MMAIRELKVCLLGVSPEPPSAGDALIRVPPTSPASHRPCAPLVPCTPLVCVSPLIPAPQSFPGPPWSVHSPLPPHPLQYMRPLFPGAPLDHAFPGSPCPLVSWDSPPVPATLGPAPIPPLLGSGFEPIGSFLDYVHPRLDAFPGSARTSPRWGAGPGRAPRSLRGDRKSGGGTWPPPGPLRPRRAFFFAFDNFLPAETLSYSAKARSPLLPLGGNWFLHF